ncbi:MAG: low molecular weight phosphotyrosine protein phosphatase [Candidatus Pacebacteria bacterium]|nr:low molecular weight phosphotyrosine protein phosphatase [Candidatus Paceibacterota bacterium]
MITNILVVCTANICRSPMAAALFQGALPRVVVSSAGLYAREDYAADPVAGQAMREYGVDLGRHRSRAVDDRMLATADLVLVMEHEHKREIERRYPQSRGKIFCLDPDDDIADPSGDTVAEYAAIASRIALLTDKWAGQIRSI